MANTGQNPAPSTSTQTGPEDLIERVVDAISAVSFLAPEPDDELPQIAVVWGWYLTLAGYFRVRDEIDRNGVIFSPYELSGEIGICQQYLADPKVKANDLAVALQMLATVVNRRNKAEGMRAQLYFDAEHGQCIRVWKG